MGFFRALLQSRKFWLTVGACVTALLTGHPAAIPTIIMVEVGAISIEDAAKKVGWSLNSNNTHNVEAT